MSNDDKQRTAVDMNKVDALAELLEIKRDLEAQLAELRAAIEEQQDDVCTEMLSAGVQQMKVTVFPDTPRECRRTVYVRRQTWAGIKDGQKQALVDLFEASDELRPFVTVNAQTLSSLARKHMEQAEAQERGEVFIADDLLPDEVWDKIEPTERITVAIRRS